MDILVRSLALTVHRSMCRCILQQNRILSPGGNVQQTRNTAILERVYPVQLHKKERSPYLKSKNYVYRLMERTDRRKLPDIECILTKNIDGIGKKGELVKVKRGLFRNNLYLAGEAVYPTEENITEYHLPFKKEYEEEGKIKVSVWADRTWVQLAGLCLRVPMSGDNPWILNKTHVRVALRQFGVEAPDECIILPDEVIKQPGEFTFTFTMKGMDPLKVRGIIYNTYKDPIMQTDEIKFPEVWRNEPLSSSTGRTPSSSENE